MSVSFKYFPDVFADLIERTKAQIPDLNIKFEYGTYLELTMMRQKKDNNQIEKYPLIWLVWDKDNNQQSWIEPCMYKISPRFFICSLTNQDYTTSQRCDNVFKPVLYPIFDALMEEMNYYANIILENNFTYTVTDHPYLVEDVQFDILSAIEVKLENITLIQI